MFEKKFVQVEFNHFECCTSQALFEKDHFSKDNDLNFNGVGYSLTFSDQLLGKNDDVVVLRHVTGMFQRVV